MKGEGVSIIKGGERRGAPVYQETIEERVYQTLKVTLNDTSVFCKKEGQ